jgi:hypothetical protein
MVRAAENSQQFVTTLKPLQYSELCTFIGPA